VFSLIALLVLAALLATATTVYLYRRKKMAALTVAPDPDVVLDQRRRSVMDKVGHNRIRTHFSQRFPAHIKIPHHANEVKERLTENLPPPPFYAKPTYEPKDGHVGIVYDGEVDLDRLDQLAQERGIPAKPPRRDLRLVKKEKA